MKLGDITGIQKPTVAATPPKPAAPSLDTLKKRKLAQLASAKPEPAPEPPAPRGPSIAELLGGKPTKPAAPTPAPKRGALYGTGITQKVLAKEATRAKRDEAAEAKAEAEPELPIEGPKPETMEVERIDDHVLPDNLMPSDLVLDSYQERAMALANERYGCLIGAAGTGKTTCMKVLVQRIIDRVVQHLMLSGAIAKDAGLDPTHVPFDIAFCSFTGKACQQMKRSLPKHLHRFVDTIHGTLGYQPTYEERWDEKKKEYRTVMVFRPTYTAINKLKVKVVVVDEAGMCPIYLWNELLAALPDDCQVILIGDINQLPPVQGRSVLGFAMLEWPTFALEKVHRTAEDSAIIQNAHRILNGKAPLPDPKKGFYIQQVSDYGSKALTTCIQAVKQLSDAPAPDLPERKFFNAIEDALIVPQNVGTIGQVALNQHLVHWFNPPKKQDGITLNPRINIKAGYNTVAFAEGDKVMLHQNDRELGLTNGMMGVVIDITKNANYRGQAVAEHTVDHVGTFELSTVHEHLSSLSEAENGKAATDDSESDEEKLRQASHVVTVKFQNVDEPVSFATAGSFNVLTHAYAFTCHKAQGSEFPTVLLLLHSTNINMLCREWLYTAVTRAQHRVVIMCNQRGLTQALNVQRVRGNTIAEKAKSFIALMDKKDTSLPNLPSPEALSEAA